jgi:hypothetical protein
MIAILFMAVGFGAGAFVSFVLCNRKKIIDAIKIIIVEVKLIIQKIRNK